MKSKIKPPAPVQVTDTEDEVKSDLPPRKHNDNEETMQRTVQEYTATAKQVEEEEEEQPLEVEVVPSSRRRTGMSRKRRVERRKQKLEDPVAYPLLPDNLKPKRPSTERRGTGGHGLRV